MYADARRSLSGAAAGDIISMMLAVSVTVRRPSKPNDRRAVKKTRRE